MWYFLICKFSTEPLFVFFYLGLGFWGFARMYAFQPKSLNPSQETALYSPKYTAKRVFCHGTLGLWSASAQRHKTRAMMGGTVDGAGGNPNLLEYIRDREKRRVGKSGATKEPTARTPEKLISLVVFGSSK